VRNWPAPASATHHANGGRAFRTEHDGERWWLVTPEGNAFISFGVNHYHAGWWAQDYKHRHEAQRRDSHLGQLRMSKAFWGLAAWQSCHSSFFKECIETIRIRNSYRKFALRQKMGVNTGSKWAKSMSVESKR